MLHSYCFIHTTSALTSTDGTQTNRLVTINNECDVEPPLQPSGTIFKHHRVERRILPTNILNLQRMVKVHPHPFHLELWALVYRLSIFIPRHNTQSTVATAKSTLLLWCSAPKFIFKSQLCEIMLLETAHYV